jgi:hypothetical protein
MEMQRGVFAEAEVFARHDHYDDSAGGIAGAAQFDVVAALGVFDEAIRCPCQGSATAFNFCIQGPIRSNPHLVIGRQVPFRRWAGSLPSLGADRRTRPLRPLDPRTRPLRPLDRLRGPKRAPRTDVMFNYID